eukprot:365528-Chlamydomonas_euryale.AAC.2
MQQPGATWPPPTYATLATPTWATPTCTIPAPTWLTELFLYAGALQRSACMGMQCLLACEGTACLHGKAMPTCM